MSLIGFTTPDKNDESLGIPIYKLARGYSPESPDKPEITSPELFNNKKRKKSTLLENNIGSIIKQKKGKKSTIVAETKIDQGEENKKIWQKFQNKYKR